MSHVLLLFFLFSTGECNLHAGYTRDVGLIPRSGRFPGEGHGNPLQHSCLENSMDRGAWWAQSMELQRAGHN